MSFAERVRKEVTSWEGVTSRSGRFGTTEFRLGRTIIGLLPMAGLVDEQTVIAKLRESYERAVRSLDRRAGVPA